MNAVEIEQAITDLAAKPFDVAEFPSDFLEAFGKQDTTLRKGKSNKSDVGDVLQANNIHIAVAPAGVRTFAPPYLVAISLLNPIICWH